MFVLFKYQWNDRYYLILQQKKKELKISLI